MVQQGFGDCQAQDPITQKLHALIVRPRRRRQRRMRHRFDQKIGRFKRIAYAF
jgi:hypothetical protein